MTWGGLFTGPGAWAVSTQLNYGIVQWQCDHGVQVIPFIALALAMVSMFGGAMSWQAGDRNAFFWPEGSRQHQGLRRQHRGAGSGAFCTGDHHAGLGIAHPQRVPAMSFDALFSPSICYGAPGPEWTLALPITLPLTTLLLL